MRTRVIVPPIAVLAVGAAVTLLPGAGEAASRTRTLRFYDKQVSLKVIHADGSVDTHPRSEPKPGDTLEANSLDYSGTRAHHARRWTASTHLVCKFGTGEPDCISHVAIGGSMLVFSGNPGTVVDGTGIYQGATGGVISFKQINGSNDANVVARIKLARR